MKIVGDREVFAFAYEKKEIIDRYLYGHFGLFVRGTLVGNYDEISTLTICNSYLTDFLTNRSKRVFPGSPNMKKGEIFQEIYEQFYSSCGNELSRKLSEYREYFWLDEVGEYSFRDKLGIILIDEPELSRQRIIWKVFNSSELFEETIPIDSFDTIAFDYLGRFK